MKYLQIKLDDDIHKRFKRLCFNKEVDMSVIIRKWINEYLQKNNA